MGNRASRHNRTDPSKASSQTHAQSHSHAPPTRPAVPRPAKSASAPAHPEAAATGRVLGRQMEDVRGTYTFGRELGRGQFGVTYLVTHKGTGERLACKSIATRKLVHKDDMDDVRREVQIMHHLTGHRNIVELKGAYEDKSVILLDSNSLSVEV
jgi:calcium-dependent protein kinase